ncbi:Glutathione import ATP-binding protein GsiA [Listeria grayi]|uniref:Glutathione import ATP-binding protein GsiA n=1 Tax=Listeria grayi TaxID=1641 RepID=A0A378MFK4_LISGR|nr:Glutathione import ATP-binding protein GsiA [Listeria grayi]
MGAVLEVRNLTTSFRIDNNYYAAVDNVSLDIYPNETIAIVGESGCGKSALALALMKLHDPLHTRISGDIFFMKKK